MPRFAAVSAGCPASGPRRAATARVASLEEATSAILPTERGSPNLRFWSLASAVAHVSTLSRRLP
eukprot:8656024-Lingulodinium_polyedra.AAC.1